MKICILTHSLSVNYGGLLQAFALQKTLKQMGHEVVTDRGSRRYLSFFKRVVLFTYHFIKRYLLGSKPHNPFNFFFYSQNRKNKEIDQQIKVNTEKFIDSHIDTIDFFRGKRKPSNFLINQFEAFIVGSDQIWRPLYLNVPAYFLDFTKNRNVKRIAYAASFGVDHWNEFSPEITKKCAQAAKRFDAISVREDSGIMLCKQYLGVEALHMIDPTMLLEKKDYLSVIEEDLPTRNNILTTYILDNTLEKQTIIERTAKRLDLTPFEIMPEEKHTVYTRDIKNCIFPSVSTWIAAFRDADFVVTDSFHGTVFSIIFNKPFIAIANEKRGNSRFTSLLKIFGLEYRLIASIDELKESLFIPIDFSKINSIKQMEKEKAIDFLKCSLGLV